jgi:hypothetical protein
LKTNTIGLENTNRVIKLDEKASTPFCNENKKENYIIAKSNGEKLNEQLKSSARSSSKNKNNGFNLKNGSPVNDFIKSNESFHTSLSSLASSKSAKIQELKLSPATNSRDLLEPTRLLLPSISHAQLTKIYSPTQLISNSSLSSTSGNNNGMIIIYDN